MSENSSTPNKPNPQKGKRRFNIYWIYVILTVVLLSLYFSGKDETRSEEIEMGQLIEMLQKGEVNKIELINKENAEIYTQENTRTPSYTYRIGSLDRFEETVERVQVESGIEQPVYITNVERKSWGLDLLFTWILPFVFIIALWFLFMRGMGLSLIHI